MAASSSSSSEDKWATQAQGDVMWQWTASFASAALDGEQLRDGMRVLDVAAGTGTSTIPLVQRVVREGLKDVTVAATDLSPGMVAQLKANAAVAGFVVDTPLLAAAAAAPAAAAAAPAAGADATTTTATTTTTTTTSSTSQPVLLQAYVDDAQHMTSPAAADASQDLVICVFGLMLMPDAAAAAREIYRVLRPGGRMVAVTWKKVGTVAVMRVLARELGMSEEVMDGLERVVYGLGEEEAVRKLMREAGFLQEGGDDAGNVVVEECVHQRERDLMVRSADMLVLNPVLCKALAGANITAADAAACIRRIAMDPKHVGLEEAVALITRAVKRS